MDIWQPKDPDAVLDYQYFPPLDPSDTLAVIDAQAISGTITIDNKANDATSMTIWLSGGVNGQTVAIRFFWTSVGGRSNDAVVLLPIRSHEADPVAIDPNVAIFDYGAWIAAYPDLAPYVSLGAANTYFALAGTLFANNALSPVCDLSQRLTYLNMIVAHLAQLYSPIGGNAPSGIVGRITEAREGDVSVKAADIAGKSAVAAFWTQTPYGLMFWTATAYLRQGFYMPGSQPNFEPFYGLPQRGFYG